jgi:hypothetical protein
MLHLAQEAIAVSEGAKIQQGMDVYGPDEQLIGRIGRVHGDGFDVAGQHFSRGAVARVERNRVYLAEAGMAAGAGAAGRRRAGRRRRAGWPPGGCRPGGSSPQLVQLVAVDADRLARSAVAQVDADQRAGAQVGEAQHDPGLEQEERDEVAVAHRDDRGVRVSADRRAEPVGEVGPVVAEALVGLGRAPEAAEFQARALKAWAKADADLPQLRLQRSTAAGQ